MIRLNQTKLVANMLVIVVALLALSGPVESARAEQQLPQEGRPFLLTGTIRISSGKYASGAYTMIVLDKPSRSPCRNEIVREILLWNPRVGDSTILSNLKDQRVVVKGAIACPNSGIQFSPDPQFAAPVF